MAGTRGGRLVGTVSNRDITPVVESGDVLLEGLCSSRHTEAKGQTWWCQFPRYMTRFLSGVGQSSLSVQTDDSVFPGSLHDLVGDQS